jgi:hypothetical protein
VKQRTTWLRALTVCGLLVILLAIIIVIPQWLYPPLGATALRSISSAQVRIQLQQAQYQLANNARATMLQLIAGLVIVAGAAATWWQVHVNRESQFTERFTRAVDQLGNLNVDVRVGGIFALERIARDSETDRNAIRFLMTIFIRNHASWPVGSPDGPQHPTPVVDRLPWLGARAPDIQAAMSALGRRRPSRDERILTLSRVDLRGIWLEDARLNGASFRESNLACAELTSVWLNHADLAAADLREASLEGSHLTEADLSRAHLQGANLRQADLSHANLRGANLIGAILDNTALTSALADQATIWPADIDAEKRRELGIIEVD